jgi:hypothetical protein
MSNDQGRRIDRSGYETTFFERTFLRRTHKVLAFGTTFLEEGYPSLHDFVRGLQNDSLSLGPIDSFMQGLLLGFAVLDQSAQGGDFGY